MTISPIGQTSNGRQPVVRVNGKATTIDHLCIDDPTVAEALDCDRPAVQMMLHLISLGALAHRATDADVVAAEFRHQMDAAVSVTEQACQNFANTVAAQSSRLFEGDEYSPSVTDQINQTMERSLVALLGTDASAGPIADLRRAVDESLTSHQRQLRNALSLDSHDSPLAALQANMLNQVTHQNRALAQQLQQLSERIAVNSATATEREKGTQKGRDFEEVVQFDLLAIANAKGHIVEATGDESGSQHNKKGDHVITIDRGLSTETRIAVESKNRGMSAPGIFAELEAARLNRNAASSIAIFARLEQSPMKTPVFLDGFGAIISLDGQNDAVLLKIAYEWAQRIASSSTKQADETDLQAARSSLDSLESAINNTRALNTAFNGIEKNLKAGRQSIDQTRAAVTLAAAGVREALGLAYEA